MKSETAPIPIFRPAYIFIVICLLNHEQGAKTIISEICQREFAKNVLVITREFGKNIISFVFAPNVSALSAAKELRWRLIARAGLNEPEICLVIAASLALLLCFGKIRLIVFKNYKVLLIGRAH